MRGTRTHRYAVCMILLLAGFLVAGAVLADDHRSGRKFKRADHGNESTGQTAAWLFGIANLPVALSLLLKSTNKVIPTDNVQIIERMTKLNRFQKKHLMKLHFWLNPIALAIALIHFLLSHCKSTALPEWGLGLIVLVAGFGIIMKLKLSPSSLRRTIFRLHTHPIPLIAIISVLLIGHSIVD